MSKFGPRPTDPSPNDNMAADAPDFENPMADDPAPETDADFADGQPPTSVEALQAALEQAKEELEQQKHAVLLAHAEQENLRKRTQRDVEKARKFALESFAKELLPIKDSLEMGLSAARDVEGNHEKVLEGMEMTLKLLTAAMEKHHIKAINPVGQPFDPELHQAMATQPSDQHEPNTVLTVYQKGYLLNDRLIRPAMVVVSQS